MRLENMTNEQLIAQCKFYEALIVEHCAPLGSIPSRAFDGPRTEAQAVSCSFCKAAPGEPCRSTGPAQTEYLFCHAARWMTYNAELTKLYAWAHPPKRVAVTSTYKFSCR